MKTSSDGARAGHRACLPLAGHSKVQVASPFYRGKRGRAVVPGTPLVKLWGWDLSSHRPDSGIQGLAESTVRGVSESRRHQGWRLAGPWQVGGKRAAADGGRSRGEALHRRHGDLEKGGAEARIAETALGQSPVGPTRVPSAEMSLKRSLGEPASPSPRRKLAGDARFVRG